MLIHDARITGSFIYNGVDISDITGSEASVNALNEFTSSYNTGSFTGSFTGDGSGLNGVVSASFATTATSSSFAATATSSSFASNATSSSFAATATSSSFATTALTSSFANDLTVAGTIVAQILNVQQVTSSVIYSSGSNVFGNSLANTQVFTGSLQVSGSSHYILGSVGVGTTNPSNARFELNIGASITTLTAARINLNSGASSGETIPVSNPNLELRRGSEGSGTFLKFINQRSGYSGIGSLAATNDAHDLRFHTGNGSEKMLLNSSGNLGLGVTPSAWATGWSAIDLGSYSSLVSGFGNTRIYSNGYNASGGDVYKATGAATVYTQTGGQHIWYNAPSGTAGNAITFTQAMTLDTSGNLLLGTATNRTRLTLRASDAPTSPTLGTASGHFILGNGATSVDYGLMFGTNNDGNTWIQSQRVDGTATAYNILLNPSGGNVGIGTTSPGARLHVYSTNPELLRLEGSGATGGNYIQFKNSSGDIGYFGYGSTGSDQMTIFQGKNADLAIFTNSVERMRITSGGNVLVGTTTDAGFKLDVSGTGRFSGVLTTNSGTNSTNGIQIISSLSSSLFTGGIEFLRTTVAGGSKVQPIRDATNGGVGLNFLVTANNTAEINATYTSALQILNTGAATFSSSVTATGGLISNGGSIGYGGGELGFEVTTSGATSGIYTLAPGSPILYFDHRATGNTGFWVWRSGTGGGTTAMTLSNAGAATFSSSVTAGGDINIPNGNYYYAKRNTGGANINVLGIASGSDTLSIKGGTSGSGVSIQFEDTGGVIAGFNNGRLGIGTTTPNSTLQVRGDNGSSASAVLRIRDTNSTARTTRLQFEDYAGVYADGLIDFKLPTAGTATGARLDIGVDGAIMSLVRGGNVGIGTTSPSVKLNLVETDEAISFQINDSSTNQKLMISNTSITVARSSGSNGNLKIGTVNQTWGANGGNLIFDTVGTERMRITSGGAVEMTGTVKTGAPSGGTAKPWKLGTVATVSPTSPNRTIEVEVDGTIYYLHAKTTND